MIVFIEGYKPSLDADDIQRVLKNASVKITSLENEIRGLKRPIWKKLLRFK